MKIKRFEASSMSEALRMVRKEFGEEAVILSAKNIKRPRRLFGKESSGWVAPMPSNYRDTPRVIALVGAHGVGKTTTAAKLAAHGVLNTDKNVALLSLDDQRIGGTTELQRYAGIIGVPFEAVSDPRQAGEALSRMAEAHLVIVDTPGLSPNDNGRQNALRRMLENLNDPEIHLLINAGAREQVDVIDQGSNPAERVAWRIWPLNP